MNTTYEQWKANREKRQGGGDRKGRPASVSSRVKTAKGDEGLSTEGVYSYNQMMRASKAGGSRPASEVGSVLSYRSVMTVEEQVHSMERKMEEMDTKMDSVMAQMDQTNRLLAQFLSTKGKEQVTGGEKKKPSQS